MAHDDTGGCPVSDVEMLCQKRVCIYADDSIFEYTENSETQRKKQMFLTPKVILSELMEKR